MPGLSVRRSGRGWGGWVDTGEWIVCLVATRNRLARTVEARVNRGDSIRRSFLVLFTARICDVPVFPGVASTCDACQ